MTECDRLIGVVGIPGSWSSEALADSVAELTGHRHLLDLATVSFDSRNGRIAWREMDLSRFDALVIKKLGHRYGADMLDRLELLEHVADCGVAMFSKPSSIRVLINRLSCSMRLQRGGVPLPATIATEDLATATRAVLEFEGAVLKPLYSTKARGMLWLRPTPRNHIEEHIRAFQRKFGPMLYVQQKVDMPGRDLGVVFLGGEYLGTYARVAGDGAWNTTTRDGGHYEAHTPSRQAFDVAQKAQSLFDLDFTTVDVVETSNGPLVFEVSAFGGFSGLKKAAGLDASRFVAQYVVGKCETREKR